MRKFWLMILSLGAIACVSAPFAFAQTSAPNSAPTSPWLLPPTASQAAQVANATAVWQDLSAADVIYLDEVHDQMDDHQAQLAIIQTLWERLQRRSPDAPKLAIAMEMFQRPYQKWLDQYLAGTIDEATLRQKSEYDQRWGFDWNGYAPILRFAKAQQLPVIALNLPTELTRHLARNGLNDIPPEQQQWLPDPATLRNDNSEYRALLQSVYAGMHQGSGSSFTFEKFERVQIAWDEGMAMAIADFRAANPDTQVVVLAGNGHVIFGYGIPSRLLRRSPQVQQRQVLLNPDGETEAETGIADYFWRSQTNPKN